MRFVTTLLLAAICAVTALGQYQPKPGETVMQLQIEGRGAISILLFTTKAPKTTEQVSKLASEGFYNGQRFHRVEKNPRPFLAMIGDPDSKTKPIDDPSLGRGGTGVRIPFEDSGVPHTEGTVSLAALPKDRNSGDCQFFFSLDTSRFLDGKHTVFGKVVAGLDVMRAIEKGDRLTSAIIAKG